MPRVSTYLNFMGNTEEAFNFYKSVFGTEFLSPISRMGDMPPSPGRPELSEAENEMVMHVELPILAGHVIMGTDMLEWLVRASAGRLNPRPGTSKWPPLPHFGHIRADPEDLDHRLETLVHTLAH
jgi:PhnB protein